MKGITSSTSGLRISVEEEALSLSSPEAKARACGRNARKSPSSSCTSSQIENRRQWKYRRRICSCSWTCDGAQEIPVEEIVFFVFNPTLVGSNLAKTITYESLIKLWFMPLNILITFIIGSALGWGVIQITRAPPHLRGLVLGCCAAVRSVGKMEEEIVVVVVVVVGGLELDHGPIVGIIHLHHHWCTSVGLFRPPVERWCHF
ncbi:hypothetical protein HYC85_008716 [Camellia sinensis]|uniref:Uncharacterized protein n=1 Tax=Camellia sinensis TaxID=4442 RepID=A0A7J7HSM7_CAMSI|nr:hypothetical protein HYC85_008716 [Camellia sinensis]